MPHITGMLEKTGWIDDRWYTEESSERGRCVHELTAAFDLGGLDVASCTSAYRGYLLGHVQAMSIIRPEMIEVEQPAVHPIHRFGGRPDRVLKMWKVASVKEIKSGLIHKSHQIQTALQAILRAPALRIPPEAVGRFALYERANGRYRLYQHEDRHDFDEARRVIKECCT